jgi:hypothetical protein
MNELPSAQFRKTYAKLTEPTMVTVNGHVIGWWNPASPQTRMNDDLGIVSTLDAGPTFNSRPFTPVPKGRR